MVQLITMEQLTLETVAQTMMDLYYKDFKQDGDFFDYDHFEYVARMAWAKLIEAEAKEWRKIARQETGFWSLDLPTDWLVSETVKIEDPKDGSNRALAVLKDAPFSFNFDRWGWAIQSVYSEKHEFERISVDSQWKLKHMPLTSRVFWYPMQNKIHFISSCKLDEAEVAYLPSLLNVVASECSLPIAKLFDITTMGLQVMLQVKNGVVDMTNNQNPNAPIQTEIDNVFQNIKTKQA